MVRGETQEAPFVKGKKDDEATYTDGSVVYS